MQYIYICKSSLIICWRFNVAIVSFLLNEIDSIIFLLKTNHKFARKCYFTFCNWRNWIFKCKNVYFFQKKNRLVAVVVIRNCRQEISITLCCVLLGIYKEDTFWNRRFLDVLSFCTSMDYQNVCNDQFVVLWPFFVCDVFSSLNWQRTILSETLTLVEFHCVVEEE